MEDIIAFDAGHEDLLHDLAYDFYGLRLMTCSSDQRLRLWAFDEAAGTWVPRDAWKAHDAPVLRVVWAHPEFGSIVASCSMDRTVRIWQEFEAVPRLPGYDHAALPATDAAAAAGPYGPSPWIERARLADARAPVHAIAFAPPHLGFQLASAAADGLVRIYQSTGDAIGAGAGSSDGAAKTAAAGGPGAPSTAGVGGAGGAGGAGSASHPAWTLMEEIEVVPVALRSQEARICLDWCPARHVPAMMVIGGGGNIGPSGPGTAALSSSSGGGGGGGSLGAPNSGAVAIGRSSMFGQDHAETMDGFDGSGHTHPNNSASATSSNHLMSGSGDGPNTINLQFKTSGHDWNPMIYRISAQNRWKGYEVLAGHTDLVTDVAWAPNLGRTYHLIATACRDGHVRIYKLTPKPPPGHLFGGDEGLPAAGAAGAAHLASPDTQARLTASPYASQQPPQQGIPYDRHSRGYLRDLTHSDPAYGPYGSGAGAGGSDLGRADGASPDSPLPSGDASHPAAAAAASHAAAQGHRFVVTLVADLSDHAAEVWQVRWNVTGTILASAGDDGTVRNWKAASGGSGGWRCLSIINAEVASAQAAPSTGTGGAAPGLSGLPAGIEQSPRDAYGHEPTGPPAMTPFGAHGGGYGYGYH